LVNVRFLNACAAIGILALIVYVLIIGQAFLMPFALAVVIWYLVISLRRTYEKVHVGRVRMPYGVALVLAVLTCFLVLYLVGVLINSNINELIRVAPTYQQRFNDLAQELFQLLGVQDEQNPLESMLADIDLRSLITRLASALTGVAGDLGMIIVYVIFLLLEHRTFGRKIDAIARTEEGRDNLRRSVTEISEDIDTYMRIKTWLSILTGALSYVVLVIVGVDFAEFWAILIFLLNYIPTIGSILGVAFPALLMLFQFSSYPLIVVVTLILLLIQVVVGNVLEPRMMGKSLNISALVIILSLALWSYIWGVIGMFLCVPIMVIVNIILAKFEGTRPIAILLSANGKID
jgi:predicted PurR-regulated permease PerM